MKCIWLEQFNFSTEKFFENPNVNFKLADVRADLFLQCSGVLFFCIFQFVLAGIELSNERQTEDICLLPRLNIVVAA